MSDSTGAPENGVLTTSGESLEPPEACIQAGVVVLDAVSLEPLSWFGDHRCRCQCHEQRAT